MSAEPIAKKRSKKWEWLFWWRISPDELQEQVAQYDTLGWFRSGRKISALLLVFSSVLTVLFATTGVLGSSSTIGAYSEAAIFLVLAIFNYRGHRWAFLCAMMLWTLEKGISILDGFSAPTHAGTIISQVIWWGAYMHAFYLAFRVEQRRRTLKEGA